MDLKPIDNPFIPQIRCTQFLNKITQIKGLTGLSLDTNPANLLIC
jgi:hypothetical protein